MGNKGFCNVRHWGVVVDEEGKVIEGGIRDAVTRGLVTEGNYFEWWSLIDSGNGIDVYDGDGVYGEQYVMCGRIMDGVVVPVEEDFFYESYEE